MVHQKKVFDTIRQYYITAIFLSSFLSTLFILSKINEPQVPTLQ